MKKQLLQFEIELDFSLIGISCHLKDYRFVWFLNKTLQSNFIKTKQFCLHGSDSSFSQFEYPMELSTAYIFANRSATGYLVNKKPQVDYWLKLETPEDEKLHKWVEEIRIIPQVLVAYEEGAEKVKEQFIF